MKLIDLDADKEYLLDGKYKVEPKRSKGKWQMVDYAWECDRCHCRQLKKKPTNFCPNCGALMEVELSYE